jgi:hypothetical protein
LYRRAKGRLADELERAGAEAAGLARGQFLAKISHELRTPLNGILGMAEVLAAGELSPEQGRQVGTLTQSAEKLLRLVEQALDHARLDGGDVPLERRPFSLRELLDGALAPWTDEARRKGVRLSREVAPGTPDRLVGDRRRLLQVLAELVENAVTFTARGEVEVRADHAGGSLSLEVRDTGVGIPPARLRGIFGAFEQVDESLTRPHGGVGLGLSLAARLVALMGGRIEAESAEGEGSAFRFRVPAEAVADSSSEVARARAALLLVADEADRQRLGGLLKDAGCSVVAVGNGQAGMTELVRGVVEGSPFTLVVLEDELPDTSAEAWLRQVEDGPARCPAILLRDAPAGNADRRRIVLPRKTDVIELRQALTQAAG